MGTKLKYRTSNPILPCTDELVRIIENFELNFI